MRMVPGPKLTCDYNFICRMDKCIKEAKFILPVNIDSEQVYTSKVDYESYWLCTTKIQFHELRPNNYPLNAFQAQTLPHVCADFGYYRSIVNYSDNRYSFTKTPKPKNYQWLIIADTNVKDQVRIYDKQTTIIHKFLNTLPPAGTDSQNVIFFKALADTFNNFRYISPNHLYYNESNLYELYSGDHILKRRLAGHTLWIVYRYN